MTREYPGQVVRGNPGTPGTARAERPGGSENWEWPGSEGEGRPKAAGVRVTGSGLGACEGVEKRQGGGWGPSRGRWLLEGGALLGEFRSCGSYEGRTRGDLERLGRNLSALPPTAGLGWETQDWTANSWV